MPCIGLLLICSTFLCTRGKDLGRDSSNMTILYHLNVFTSMSMSMAYSYEIYDMKERRMYFWVLDIFFSVYWQKENIKISLYCVSDLGWWGVFVVSSLSWWDVFTHNSKFFKLSAWTLTSLERGETARGQQL